MKRAEAGLVAKEWPTSHGHATSEQDVDGGVQPDHWNAGISEEFGSAGLGVSAATESKDCGFVELIGATESRTQLIRFQLTEGRFAVTFKEFGNGDSGSFLDAFVEVNEAPAELACETSTNSTLASAHKTGKT